MKQFAFTLAEVLITLAVVGAIAAITIPIIMANYQKTQYATQLKKAYTQMNQVLQQMAADNGTPDSISDYFGPNQALTGDAIASYYKLAKNCKNELGQGCWANIGMTYDGSSGTYDPVDLGSMYKFITADGMSFSVASSRNNCTTNRGFSATPDSPTYNSTCAEVYIDINGLKKPNNRGRDVFLFYITSKKTPMLYPMGGFYDSYDSNTGTSSGGGSHYWNKDGTSNRCSASAKTGHYCTGRLIEEGWQMNY